MLRTRREDKVKKKKQARTGYVFERVGKKIYFGGELWRSFVIATETPDEPYSEKIQK